MKRNKRIISIIMIIFIFNLLTIGCQKAPESSSGISAKTLRISFINPWRNSPYWQEIERGMQSAAKDLGDIDLEILGPSSINSDKTIRDFFSAIAARSDGILSFGSSDLELSQAIEKSIDQKIPVVLVDADIPLSGRIAFIGTEHHEAGKLAGQKMAELTEGSAHIGVITIDKDLSHLNKRIDGFTEAIASFPNMSIDASEEAADILTAGQMTRKMLDDFPAITDIFVTAGELCIGAAQVLQERNLSGKVKLIGFDLDAETIKLIKSGTISASVAQRPFEMGYQGLAQLVQFIHTGQVSSEIIYTPVIVVTQNNIDMVQSMNTAVK